MRQSGLTHEESIQANKENFCLEKDSWFQQPNDAAAEHCTGMIRSAGGSPAVVELGCGDGAALRKFQELKIHTLGVDINTEKLSYATGIVIESDMLQWLLDQPDETVSNIFMHHSLEHIVAVPEVLTEIARVLDRGGIFYCVVPADDTPHSVHNTAFDSAEELAPVGLRTVIAEKQIRFEHPEFLYVGYKE